MQMQLLLTVLSLLLGPTVEDELTSYLFSEHVLTWSYCWFTLIHRV